LRCRRGSIARTGHRTSRRGEMDQTGMVCCGLPSNIATPLKFKRWKLHLRPKDLPSSHVNDSDIPQLPQNRSAVEVLGDFLKYLYECARSYIQDTHGKDLWKSIENHIQFVLTHPNGWEGAQQSQIRRAAVLAGLIHDDQDGQSHLQFVTEGEASLHYCLRTSGKSEKFLPNLVCLFPK
jgi:hypothetical protein